MAKIRRVKPNCLSVIPEAFYAKFIFEKKGQPPAFAPTGAHIQIEFQSFIAYA
jgi:hypothetical protein